MATERRTICQPAELWAKFQAQARAERLSLSAWLAEAGIARLPESKRKNIPARDSRFSAQFEAESESEFESAETEWYDDEYEEEPESGISPQDAAFLAQYAAKWPANEASAATHKFVKLATQHTLSDAKQIGIAQRLGIEDYL